MKEALQRLNDAGHVAYIVGGTVRDFILGRPTKDHDIATSASPDELCRIFPKAITVGKAFGVLKIPVPGIPHPLEIATFREDLEYKDHRHPEGVRFSGPAEDAARRDFTVNALYYDPKTSRILDSVGGMDDMKAKVLRAIGDPMERFREDALRLLRAVRFTTTLGFTLEESTATAVRARAKLISKVSQERIRDELTGMWTGPAPTQALKLLADLGLLALVLPELETLRTFDRDISWRHTLKVLDVSVEQTSKRSLAYAWATVLIDVGKPAAFQKNKGQNFNTHEIEGAKIAAAMGKRLRMAAEDISLMVWLIEEHLKFREVFQMRESTLQRFIRQENIELLLGLHKAYAIATDGNLAFYEFCQSRLKEIRSSAQTSAGESAKLLSGEDLIQLGMKPGPQFAEILRSIEDLTLERKLSTKEEALEYVVKHFVR